MHLEPRNAERHHDICHGVRFREKVGNLAAGFYVPIRYAEIAHLLFGVARKFAGFLYLALTHRLHRLESESGLHALLDKVDHDVVAATDGLVDRGDAVYDEVVDVARPHVGAVGEAGQTHKRVELLGLGIHKHLPGKGRAELRNADRAGLADYGIVVRQTESRGGDEDRHRFRVGKGNFLRVHAGHVLHHAYHGGVIMPQLVKL